ncbi:methionine--tRNA ligase [Sporolactobacillus pectinivorans]|uniref:methionine--tRNA ligase n=1 Tax=Sporolactobacillus pectinivorans TaxID=1591408 RepID=UPI000C25FF72|nr:methionine--tRNA ligase [Sporolactobacillus pectinivorans]
MAVLIAGAWPYANGELHLGHLSSLLPGDCLARYYRLKGEKVLYVSGSDCNGTPITIRARQEGVSPKVIADRYHQSFAACFEKLGFTYDCYTRTDTPLHHRIVQQIFKQLYDHHYIYLKETKQMYCTHCQQFLPDRYVEGVCPHCGAHARGDQCEACSTILDPTDLLQPTCKICGHTPELRNVSHLYFALSQFEPQLRQLLAKAEEKGDWRENAIQLTRRYLDEGLQDRAVTRDLPVGVPVPVKGFEDKKVYVWIEAVSGYYSASECWAQETGHDISEFWDERTISYYVQGKDNIPFHTIIWPAILLCLGKKALPTHLVSNEYVTLEKKKLSTSRNWAVWIPDILSRYDADSIRYFMLINAPESHDADFSWRAFIESHNGELLGAYGNLVNRTLKFIEKLDDFKIRKSSVDPEMRQSVEEIYAQTGRLIEQTQIKEALNDLFSFIRRLNKYFDEKQPWNMVHINKVSAYQTLNTCLFSLANLAQLLSPFLPFSSEKLGRYLHLNPFVWKMIDCPEQIPEKAEPLFAPIDHSKIDEEIDRLNRQSKK